MLLERLDKLEADLKLLVLLQSSLMSSAKNSEVKVVAAQTLDEKPVKEAQSIRNAQNSKSQKTKIKSKAV